MITKFANLTHAFIWAILAGFASSLIMPGSNASGQTYTFADLYTMNVPSGYGSASYDGDRPIASGGAAVGSAYGPSSYYPHALLWNSTGQAIDLNPASGYRSSRVYGADGAQQVGWAAIDTPLGSPHGMLWNGSNEGIDLNPNGFEQSYIYAAHAGQQVGYGNPTGTGQNSHALLWNGTNVAVDLNPTNGSWQTEARGVGGGQQVGSGKSATTAGYQHALLWNGTNTAVDLHPTGFLQSWARGTDGSEEVGIGYTSSDSKYHALLWHGTDPVIDLHPAGFTDSWAVETNGGKQVGYGLGPSGFHALLWNGTSATTDLGALLSADFNWSEAYTLDASGNVFGLAIDANRNYHAVEWIVSAPEPSCLSLLTVGGIGLIRRRRPVAKMGRGRSGFVSMPYGV